MKRVQGDMTGLQFVDRFRQDITYGLRMVLKNPGFSAVAVVSLAIGIGASTVLFGFANAFLFRPLQAANASQLMRVFTSNSRGGPYGGSSYADYEDYRDHAGVFSGLLAATGANATLSGADRAELVNGELVSGNYFDVLGLQPSRGRSFLPEEARTPASHPVVVLSHHAWLRRFGADPEIVGRVIRMNGHPFTVIGIGPDGFAGTSFETAADFFVPVMMHAAISPGSDTLRTNRRGRIFRLFGRLKPGVTRREAGTAMARVAARLFEQHPDAWRDEAGRQRTVTVLPELEARLAASGPEPIVWLFASVMAAVVALLGITCVNVATVLLARGATRRREIAIRLAMGASRRRIVRQLLTECALLGGAGGVTGLAIAHWAAVLFARFRPDEAPAFDLSVDYRILFFSIAAAAFAVVCFGLVPALQATRPDLNAELKGLPRTVRIRRFQLDLRDALVIVQVAVALALIVGAGLMYRSLLAGQNEDPGFRKDGVLSLEVDLTTVPVAGGAHARVYREAVRAIAAIPGVDRVALAALVPMDGSNITTKLTSREGAAASSIVSDVNVVGAGYFALMGIPVLQGREFGPSDREGLPRVALVNELMARVLWNGDAVGRILEDSNEADVHVIGIVRNLRHRSFAEEPIPMVYFAADQGYRPRMTVHVRTDGPPTAIGAAIQRTLRDMHPAVVQTRVRTMAEHLDFVTMPQRLGGWGAAATGALELGLALMALYGVIAYAASQRTREIGLRMALGATRGSVIRLMMRKGLMLAGAGIVIGVGLALAVGPVLASLLIGVGAADPVSFAGASVLLLLIVAAASYVPARRALEVDPSVALRME